MATAPYYAKDFSLEARTFLYACAFWLVASDEKLKPQEQAWLKDQFGEEGALQSLDEFVALDSAAFFEAFDNAVTALSDADKQRIYPELDAWLRVGAEADGQESARERDTILRIRQRIDLRRELADLPEDKGLVTEVIGERKSSSRFSAGRPDAPTDDLQGHHGEISCVAVAPGGALLATGSEDGSVRIWQWESRCETACLEGHDLGVAAVLFPDDQHVVTADRIGRVRCWALDRAEPVWSMYRRGQGGATGLAFAGTSGTLACCTNTGLIRLLDRRDGALQAVLGNSRWGSLHAVALSADGKTLFSGGDDRCVRVWDVASQAVTGVWEGHRDGVMALALSADGAQLVSGGRDNDVRVWSTQTAACTLALAEHQFSVYGVDLHPRGKYLASAGWDHKILLWRLPAGELVRRFDSPDARFSDVVFHPSGDFLIVAGSDDAAHIVHLSEDAVPV